MIRPLACLLIAAAPVFAADAPLASQPVALPYTLPATMQHHRFFVQAQAPSGEVLQLLTDTGGGMNLGTRGADKLGLSYAAPKEEQREPVGMAPWPDYAGPWIPRPESAPADYTLPIMVFSGMESDGMLGAAWHGGRTWEWDYAAGTLRLLPDGAMPQVDPSHVVALGFQEEDGERTTHFPRIPVVVDGEVLHLLFDTGATFRLSEDAAKALGEPAVRTRAGSFIIRSVMERWHAAHPDWPWIDGADSGAPMIRVPMVEVAGYRVGPVWFSGRADHNFREWMAQWMDRPIDGALGGSAFAGLRITVDYDGARAAFERVGGDEAAGTGEGRTAASATR